MKVRLLAVQSVIRLSCVTSGVLKGSVDVRLRTRILQSSDVNIQNQFSCNGEENFQLVTLLCGLIHVRTDSRE